MLRSSLLLLALAGTAAALYSAGDDVVQLTDKDFDKKVIKTPGVTLVEFYAPWCGHCKNLVPAWKEAARALKGVVTVAAVDATAAESLAARFKIQGFPTIKAFIDGKPVDYNGGRDAPSIVNWAMGQASSAVKARMGGKAGGKAKGKGGAASGGAGNGGADASQPGGGKAVVTLTPDNFDTEVFSGKDAWMIEFYAPWCGHCKNLAPEWASAAEQMKGEVRFAAIDADQHRELAQRFGVRGFPTIVSFARGAKGDSDAKPYNGGRSASDLVAAAAALAGEGGPGKVVELTDADVWAELCTGKNVCVLSILPHILDDGAKKRNAKLSLLAEAAGKVRGAPFKFVWVEAGAQPKLEAALAFGMAPAVYAIAGAKGIYTPHRGALAEKPLATFVKSLTSPKGASGSSPLPSGFDVAAALARTAPWDGKDGKPPAEDL